MHRAASTLAPKSFLCVTAALFLSLPLLALPAPATGPFAVAGPLPGVVLQPVANALGPLTSITHAGDGRLFLTTKNGLVLVIDEGGVLQPGPFLILTDQVSTADESGLLGLAFHPLYAENGLFFIAYNDLDGSIVLARYQVLAGSPDQADPASARVLLTIPKTTASHNGGQLHFGPDGYLYMSVGDSAGREPENVCAAQIGSMLLGKLLRLDVDEGADTPPYYSIPLDNPFRGTGTMRDEVWAFGFRNPWRFSFDRATGDLWVGDVGQSRFEEIDVLPAGVGGQNFGWKMMEGTACFRRGFCPAEAPLCGSPLLTPPVLEYEHTDASQCFSVTGGYVYRGSRLPQVYGNYVFSDFCSGLLWDAAPRAAGSLQVRQLAGAVPLITTFGEDRQGELYAGTIGGTLYRLAPRGPIETVGGYNPADARFFFRNLHLAGAADRSLLFGPAGDGIVPLAGDWNRDGQTTIGTWNPATGQFRLKNTLTQGPANVTFILAARRGATPLAGDWNRDGRDSVGWYDPAASKFELRNALSSGKSDVSFRYGPPGGGWLPVTGDWDGDGRDTVGLYDPATATFHLKNTFKGSKDDIRFAFGPAGNTWIPIAGDWDGDGRDGIGLFDPETSTFRLKNVLKAGLPNHIFQFGPAEGGWLPVVGEW